MSRHLTLADALAIHADLIAVYGGIEGVRDPGQIEAALFRPQSGYYPDVLAEAAALWESLSQNHPFADGNKRTAFASMHAFLSVNGIDLTADAEALWAFLSPLYDSGTFRFDLLDGWLRENTRAA